MKLKIYGVFIVIMFMLPTVSSACIIKNGNNNLIVNSSNNCKIEISTYESSESVSRNEYEISKEVLIDIINSLNNLDEAIITLKQYGLISPDYDFEVIKQKAIDDSDYIVINSDDESNIINAINKETNENGELVTDFFNIIVGFGQGFSLRSQRVIDDIPLPHLAVIWKFSEIEVENTSEMDEINSLFFLDRLDDSDYDEVDLNVDSMGIAVGFYGCSAIISSLEFGYKEDFDVCAFFGISIFTVAKYGEDIFSSNKLKTRDNLDQILSLFPRLTSLIQKILDI